MNSDGLSTIALPAAIAGAILRVASSIGVFQGEIAATTPWGSRTSVLNLPARVASTEPSILSIASP